MKLCVAAGLVTQKRSVSRSIPPSSAIASCLKCFSSSTILRHSTGKGHDAGTQYRSAIFYHTPEQKQVADDVIAAITKEEIYPRPVVTQIEPAGTWYEAEAYHQEYFARNPFQGYCTAVVGPKVVKFRKQFASKLKT